MLIRSDFAPGPWGKFKCKQSHRDDLDAREAFEGILRGDEVTPADAATTEAIASALDAKGNGTRAAMLRKVAGQDVPIAPPTPSEPPPAEPVPPPTPPVDESQAAALAAAEAGRAIDHAGEDLARLSDLAYRAGLTPSPRWKADRLRLELQAAVAKNLAEGRAAFPG